jgi:hypothetical protein
MLAIIHGFSCTAEACQKKFEIVFKLYKEDKFANLVSGNDRRECRSYNFLDQWWHQASSVIKHVSATTEDSMSGGAQDNCADET